MIRVTRKYLLIFLIEMFCVKALNINFSVLEKFLVIWNPNIYAAVQWLATVSAFTDQLIVVKTPQL